MTGKRRILVVDDEPDVLDSLTLLLRDDYDVVTALDGIEALARVQAEPFDVVVLDLMMPLLDGALLKRTMNILGWGVPVILLSALGDVGSRARDIGAADYVRKPFDPADLEASIARALRTVDGWSPS